MISSALRTPFRQRRFERRGDKIIQRSMVERDLAWEITQVADTINPQSPALQPAGPPGQDGPVREASEIVWGDIPGGDEKACAHASAKMSCIACHSSWNPSCFGCHLPQRANKKMPQLHNEGDVTRNYVSYNFQTLRDDVFMLATRRRRDGQPDRPGAVVVRDPRRARTTPTASRSTFSSRRSRARGCRASPSAPTCRTRSGAGRRCSTTRAIPAAPQTAGRRTRAPICRATPTPRCAPTATSPRPTTTTRSWPSS